MKRLISDIFLRNPFSKNWEADIGGVHIEACNSLEDPLGYKAVFYLNQEKERAEKKKSFVIGASFLAQRKQNLVKAGYKAPMTRRAISMIEGQIGKTLPLDPEHIIRTVT